MDDLNVIRLYAKILKCSFSILICIKCYSKCNNAMYLGAGCFSSGRKSLYWQILEAVYILYRWVFVGKFGWHLKWYEVSTKACTHQIITEGLKRVSPTNIQSVFIQHLYNSDVVSTVRLSHEHKDSSVRDIIYTESTITRLRSHYLFRFPL